MCTPIGSESFIIELVSVFINLCTFEFESRRLTYGL